MEEQGRVGEQGPPRKTEKDLVSSSTLECYFLCFPPKAPLDRGYRERDVTYSCSFSYLHERSLSLLQTLYDHTFEL